MPIYYYKAIDANGKKRKGFIEAQNLTEAKDKLREQGVMLTQLSPQGSFFGQQGLKGDQLLAFTLLLSQLISSGVPLYESLIAIEEQYRNEKTHRIVLSLCEQVKAGSSLSDAMASFPGSFDKLYCAMIGAGEAAGALDTILERLCQLLSRRVKLKKQITTALIYPCILATFSLLVIFLLLTFVVPSIEGIFMDRELNAYTRFVMELSHIFQKYWWLIGLLLISGIGWSIYQYFTPKGKAWMQRQLLKMPLIRTLIIQTALIRFCRTLATLLQGGVSMIDSLRLSREVMQNPTLEEEVELAEIRIIEGSSLSKELIRSRFFPHLVARMMAVGEETGNIITMLNKIGEMYEEQLEKTLDRVMALAQPVILIVMGTLIGMVMLAILIPLTDVSSLTLGK